MGSPLCTASSLGLIAAAYEISAPMPIAASHGIAAIAGIAASVFRDGAQHPPSFVLFLHPAPT